MKLNTAQMYTSYIDLNEIVNTFIPTGLKHRTNDSDSREGVVFAVRHKAHFDYNTGSVRGFIVTKHETLVKQLPYITHFTPNVYRYGSYSDEKRTKIKGFTTGNLQQINCFVFELDIKVDIADIFAACEEEGFGMPTMIVESDRGYHIYFVLDNPLFINTNNVTESGEVKTIFMANRLAKNIKEALAKKLPIDQHCNAFGFFRAPNKNNVRWFNKDYSYSLKDILNWSMDFESDKFEDKGDKTARFSSRAVALEWIHSLIDNPAIRGEKGQYGRNNVLFTIALTCMNVDMKASETFDILDQFNSNLDIPMKNGEVKTILNSAYSGKYKGPSNSYIRELQQLYGTVGSKEQGGYHKVWYKFKKERKDRVRSHCSEWEEDIIRYIEEVVASGERFIWRTQKEMCAAIGIPESTLNVVLKNTKKIIKVVKGKGRGALTGWSTVAVHVRYLQEVKKQSKQAYVQALEDLTVGVTDKKSYAVLKALETALLQGEDVPAEQITMRLIE